jgi:hypothetical protein
MFTEKTKPIDNLDEKKEDEKKEDEKKDNKTEDVSLKNDITIHDIDKILERERQQNKRDNWIKLDKTAKIQKLHVYAETYGKDNSLPSKDVKLLKNFFISCLDKNKLSKSKDVVYNKEEMKILSIPALHFNKISHNFTLKIIDTKRVSTLKSLTPKKITNTEENKKLKED